MKKFTWEQFEEEYNFLKSWGFEDKVYLYTKIWYRLMTDNEGTDLFDREKIKHYLQESSQYNNEIYPTTTLYRVHEKDRLHNFSWTNSIDYALAHAVIYGDEIETLYDNNVSNVILNKAILSDLIENFENRENWFVTVATIEGANIFAKLPLFKESYMKEYEYVVTDPDEITNYTTYTFKDFVNNHY